MGLWSKGIERSQTGEIRLDEIIIPENLLKTNRFNDNFINIQSITNMLRQNNYQIHKKLDMSKPQFIWWGRFYDRTLVENLFVITDPVSEIYVVGSESSYFLKISNYNKNILTQRSNVKSNFIQTIKNIGRTGYYWSMNLDNKNYSILKHLIKHVSKTVKPYPTCEKIFYEWLDK